MAKLTERQRTDNWRKALLKAGVKAPEQRTEPATPTRRTVAVYERTTPAIHKGTLMYNRLV